MFNSFLSSVSPISFQVSLGRTGPWGFNIALENLSGVIVMASLKYNRQKLLSFKICIEDRTYNSGGFGNCEPCVGRVRCQYQTLVTLLTGETNI